MYLNSAHFSPDGKMIVTSSWDSTAKIWDSQTGRLLGVLRDLNSKVGYALFSPDGRKIVTSQWDNTSFRGRIKIDSSIGNYRVFIDTASDKPADYSAKIWDVVSHKLLFVLNAHTGWINSLSFSPDGKRVATASEDHSAKIWDVFSGKLLADLKGHLDPIKSVCFSPDGKSIVTASFDGYAKIWDVASGKLIFTLSGFTGNTISFNAAQFSPNGKKIVTASEGGTAMLWEVASGKKFADLKGHTKRITLARFCGEKKILTVSEEYIKIWDFNSGNLISTSERKKSYKKSIKLSSEEINLIDIDSTGKIWDEVSGNLLAVLKGYSNPIIFGDQNYPPAMQFSPDRKKVVIASFLPDSTANVWDAVSGSLLLDLKGHSAKISTVQFSSDGLKIVTASMDNTAKVWDAQSGDLLADLKGHTQYLTDAEFSADGLKIVTSSGDETAKVWDALSGKLLVSLLVKTNEVQSAHFSPDGKKIITISDGIVKTWDVESGNQINEFEIDHEIITAEYSSDGKRILTSSRDNTCKIFDSASGNLLYTFFAVDSVDYLVLDKFKRYDGTEAARKMLYFNCGIEIISLNQVKDQLWVPNLAERINKKDSIGAPKLSDLMICGYTPLVEILDEKNNQLRFKIIPRSGGLGETVLYINGNETKRYKKSELVKSTEGYVLAISKNDLKEDLLSGQENPIAVKAYAQSNDISSRGVVVSVKGENKNKATPNLYAVMVGVSDYKENDLKLKYAAKDAHDLSKAVESVAKKWFNNDGKDHVFIFNLTTDKNRYLLPEKSNIKEVLEEISKKANSNDILFIFFAGHGVTRDDDKKQFYLLTEDASFATITSSAIKDVGISALELADWIRPAKIKAQKRILILDACNSGQAINDILRIGQANQDYMAARNDNNAEQIKSIDKLNEKSGLFILAASASNQSAYEMSRYAQGFLTYALLKEIKLDQSILQDDKYLDVSRWFNSAERTVIDLGKENGARQQPQIVSTTNFNIGIVDDEVRKNIVLPYEKPFFASSNVQNNDENVEADDLALSKIIDNTLSSVSEREINNPFVFMPATNSSDAYSINGRYDVDRDSIIIKINIRKNNDIIFRFKKIGTTNNVDELANSIVKEVCTLLEHKR